MTDEVKVKRRSKVPCSEHKGEFGKFFCRDCKKTLCQTCCILHHKKCESVVSLESMLPEMRSSLAQREEALIEKSKVEEEKVDSLQSRSKEIDEKKSSIESQIQSTAKRVIDAVKKKEKELLDELTEVTDKEMEQLKAQIKTGDMAQTIYRQQSELLDQALNCEGEMDLYDLYQSSESEAAESVGDMEKRRTMTWVEFSQDVGRLDSELIELSLGKIQVLDEVDLDTVSTPVLSHTVDCRTKEDEYNPNIYDLVVREVEGSDTVIVADEGNKCIKSFYSRNNQHHYSRLSLKSYPYRIAKLEDNKIAVTLPDSKQIVVVSVNPDLTLDSTITTQKEYWSLTALTPSTLAAGSDTPPCLDIIDRSGNVIRSISPVHKGGKIIQYQYFLSTTRQGNILVSDYRTKSVVCLTPQGEVVFNYSPTGDRAFEDRRGITSTATGHILVVDFGGHQVNLLRESGEFVRDLLTLQEGIYLPFCIDWDERGRIYVTNLQDDIETVQVFAFK